MSSLKKKFNLVIMLLIFIPSFILIVITNLFMKNFAYQEAYNKMEIMMIRTNAIHQYLNETARPVVFEIMEQYQVPNSFFRPEIMSSTYAVREINRIFAGNIETDYYFKEIAINPRNPKNEANEFEAEILLMFNNDSTITEYQAKEVIDGQLYFRYIKKGETLEDYCMVCHSNPELAPQGLVDIYGDERGFHREVGEVVSAQSIMIPLTEAYQTANRLSLAYGGILLAFMSGVAVFLYGYTDRLIFSRIDRLKQHFDNITTGRAEIQEQMVILGEDEISELNNYFNHLAVKVSKYEEELEAERDLLKEKVKQQTSSLLESNKLLSKEMANSKLAKEKLAQYASELERSNKELQDFASIASHDLQEPLRKVLAFSDRLKKNYGNNLDEQGRDYFARIEKATCRMQNLINDLLEYSRVTTTAKPYEPVDLNLVVKDVVGDLQVLIDNNMGSVEIKELPVIEADKVQMTQLFQNLIANGIKFHREGISPKVIISSKKLNEDNWEIYISDNGIGFDIKYIERIFKPFQRLHGRNTYEGSGMGLAICQKIVTRHQGEITAISKLGAGATFIVKLPIRQFIDGRR